MVNLLEPFLVSFLKPRENQNHHGKSFETNLTPLALRLPTEKILHRSSPLEKNSETIAQPKLTRIKESFLSKESSTHWADAIQQKGIETKDLKPLWNFLFPEIPWTKERIDWVDQRKKRSFQGIFGREENTNYFCILFDSSQTGKIWIFFTDLSSFGKQSELLLQTEREASFIKIQKDMASLRQKLSGIGIKNFRIHCETRDEEMNPIRKRGILV